jgi:hypothetical protein
MKRSWVPLLVGLLIVAISIGAYAVHERATQDDRVVCMLPGDFLTPAQQRQWNALDNCPGSMSVDGPKINPSPNDPSYRPPGTA